MPEVCFLRKIRINKAPKAHPMQKLSSVIAVRATGSTGEALPREEAIRTALPVIFAGKICVFLKPTASTHPATKTINRTSFRLVETGAESMETSGSAGSHRFGDRTDKIRNAFRQIGLGTKFANLSHDGTAYHDTIRKSCNCGGLFRI